MLHLESRLTARRLTPPLLALLVALGGCASIFTGTSDKLSFDANVPGVRLSIDGQYQGELPLTVTVSRNFMNGEQFKAKFEKAGYQTQEFQLKRQFNTVAVLDVTSIPTSGGIDLLTGSLMRFSPHRYHVQMLKKGQSAHSAEFERSLELYRYALVNYRHLRTDIAHGGGEYLSSFATALGGPGGDDAAITAQALRHAPALLRAADAPDFVRRFNAMLGGDPRLRSYMM